METNDEAADDQGSGWFQVKKKHRRFSIQSWVGGFTAKNSTNLVRSSYPSNEKTRSSHGRDKSHTHRDGRNSAACDKNITKSSTTVSIEKGKGIHNTSDHEVNQDNKSSEMPPLVVNNCDNAEDSAEVKKLNVVHKFKWGALEDDDLVLHHQNSLGAEIKFGASYKFGDITGDNLLTSRKDENDLDRVSCSSFATSFSHTHSSSSSNLQSRKSIATKVDTRVDSVASTQRGETVETGEEVKEKTINVVEVDLNQKVILPDVSNELAQNNDESDCKEAPIHDNEPVYDDLKHHQNSPRAEIKFGDIKDDNFLGIRCRETNSNSLPVGTSICVDAKPCGSTYDNAVTEISSGEVNGKLSDSNKLGCSTDLMVLMVNEMINEKDNDVTGNKEMHMAHSHQSSEMASTATKVEGPKVANDVNDSKSSKVSVDDGDSKAEALIQVTDSLTPETSGLGISVEDARDQQDGRIDDSLSQSQNMNASRDNAKAEKDGVTVSGGLAVVAPASDSGVSQDGKIRDSLPNSRIITATEDGETAESKERFRQRLWCFLFENLNRAIDELYLLCELECDEEQMKEAILVLEEAASDFKELATRVKEFENIKKSSSQATDGVPTTLKTDHRRPHALSWEVRRMTTSPHRAEILASSLEAFRKIQEERASLRRDYNVGTLGIVHPLHHQASGDILENSTTISNVTSSTKNLGIISGKENSASSSSERPDVEFVKSSKVNFVKDGHCAPQKSSTSDASSACPPFKSNSSPSGAWRNKREPIGSESDMAILRKDKMLVASVDKSLKSMDNSKKQGLISEKDKEKKNNPSWKTMDAWKEKRNWEDILSSRVSHSPGMSRKSAERARILHVKLMSPEKKKKTALDLKREAEEKHARAMRIRSELENERVQKLQRTSEKLNRVSERQAVRSMKLREGMNARHQRGESRHEAYIAQVVKRAGDESSKVNEVRFITSLNEENKKFMLRQKLQDSELRRAEKLQVMKIKQKEDMAREEAVLERKKLIEAEKLQRLAEIQRKKEEAQVRREEERKASSAAREARAIEQLRRREERAKAQQEEAELLAQKLAEKLRESEQRRKFFLEQIRERASMDFRDQSSPFLRRSMNKEGQGRSTPTSSADDYQTNCMTGPTLASGHGTLQPLLKRRVKKIRQRLMAMKYEFSEPPVGFENAGIGFRTAMGAARAKMGRWLQELKRLRQARKEGAASIGLTVAEMVKFLDGKEAELQASRQAGLLDFIASALPASHTSKPEACQVTIYLLKLLKVVLSAPTNRSYFLAQNLLSPIIPMLSAALENYIKIAASLNVSGTSTSEASKAAENLESITEVLDGFLSIVAMVIGHKSSDDRELQMQDGLLELLIAYQVIHRLRELFALYDRPQVEASPFASTILLSIHLLVVLTSRPEASAPIDWGSSAMETSAGNECTEAKFVDLGDHRPSSSVVNGGPVVPSLGLPEDMISDTSSKMNTVNEATFNEKGTEKRLTDGSIELDTTVTNDVQASDESKKILVQQKDEEISVNVGGEQRESSITGWKEPVPFLLSALSETGLVSLPSLLTSVLLQANNRSSSEQASNVLPSNFEEVATGVLKVLNNLALLDITFIQRMLARPDLKMEFFHIMSFLLSHCTNKWKTTTDQVGLLLLESLLLLGHFSLFHHGNQAVLRWGKSPTILHKICDLPFVFFSDPELMPVLAGVLVAACYGSELNKDVVQQELSLDMLLSLLKSCRNALPPARSNPTLEDPSAENSCETNHQGSEAKKSDLTSRPSRCNPRSMRVPLGRGAASGNNTRLSKARYHRDSKATKSCEEMTFEYSMSVSEGSAMLHCRFPSSFIDRAEHFFSRGCH